MVQNTNARCSLLKLLCWTLIYDVIHKTPMQSAKNHVKHSCNTQTGKWRPSDNQQSAKIDFQHKSTVYKATIQALKFNEQIRPHWHKHGKNSVSRNQKKLLVRKIKWAEIHKSWFFVKPLLSHQKFRPFQPGYSIL